MTLIITKLYIGLYLRKVILFCQKKSKLQFNEFINLQFYIILSIFKKGQRMNGNLLIGLGIVISSGYIYLSMQNINRDFLNIENKMSIPRVTNATQKDISNIFFKHNDKSTKKEERNEDYYVEELALPTSIQSKDIAPVEVVEVETKKESAPIVQEQPTDDFSEESLIAESLLIESINEQSQEKEVTKERENTPQKSEKPITPPSQVVTKESTTKTVEVIKESQTPVNDLKESSKKEQITVVKSRETILEDEIKAALEEISAIEENNKN